jgi:N-acyl-L-homoserine lactone synthetase
MMIAETNPIKSLAANRSTESGVSKAIRRSKTAIMAKETYQVNSSEFTIKIANTLNEREEVFKLAYQVYLEKGYTEANAQEMLIQDYDANPDTAILVVKDKNNKIAGSVTLVFKNELCLPSENIFSEEISSLELTDKKMVEISRLVIDSNYRNSKEIILLLFNYLSIYSYRNRLYTHLIIQVNPRHEAYYEKLLAFQKIGAEKICPRVQGAPAVLLILELEKQQEEIARFSIPKNIMKKERSLYQSFLKPEQEKLVAYYLDAQYRPISTAEKLYFGLEKYESNNQIYV